jgi:O-antigen ligase
VNSQLGHKLKLDPENIFFFGLSLMAIGLPLSIFLMSLSQFIMGGAWLLQGNFKERSKRFLKNPVVIALGCIILLHLVGLLWSTDLRYGFKDTKTKLPIFLVPFLCATIDFKRRERIKTILLIFVFSVLIGTIISTGIWLELWGKQANDIRGISIFISHIRFSLLICMSIFICGHLANHAAKKVHKLLLVVTILWLIAFLFILSSVTGLVVLLVTSLILGLRNLFKRSSIPVKASLVLIPLALCLTAILFIKKEYNAFKKTDNIDLSKLPQQTVNGNPYTYEFHNLQRENGHYVFFFICKQELYKEWPKVSNIHLDSLDNAKQPIYATLIRYLTSKNLTKDSVGISKLSKQEIKFIEDGIANEDYLEDGIRKRLKQIFWEFEMYDLGKKPDGHSVTMRLEFWKTAIMIIRDKPLFGVGTGDIVTAFKAKYISSGSKLSEKWRLRSHNQFLSIAVSFGIVGLIIFLSCLFYAFKFFKPHFIFFAFFCVIFISMFTEDTIESQAGVTFFTFFSALYVLFVYRNSTNEPDEIQNLNEA